MIFGLSTIHLLYLTRCTPCFFCGRMSAITNVCNPVLYSTNTWNICLQATVLPHVQRAHHPMETCVASQRWLNMDERVPLVSSWWVRSHNWTIHSWKCGYLQAFLGWSLICQAFRPEETCIDGNWAFHNRNGRFVFTNRCDCLHMFLIRNKGLFYGSNLMKVRVYSCEMFILCHSSGSEHRSTQSEETVAQGLDIFRWNYWKGLLWLVHVYLFCTTDVMKSFAKINEQLQ